MVPRPWGVLIPGRSVHGMFMAARLWAVGLDRALLVFGEADAVLELRADRVPPQRGWSLSWKGGVVLWPGF